MNHVTVRLEVEVVEIGEPGKVVYRIHNPVGDVSPEVAVAILRAAADEMAGRSEQGG